MGVWGEDSAQLRTSIGDSSFVPEAIERMLAAATPEDATAAYWTLDNRVVVQGQLFEAAPAVAARLLEAICAGQGTRYGLQRAMDLMVEIAYGEADQTEIALGNSSLGEQCRSVIAGRRGCILQLAEAETDERILLGVIDVVDRVESDEEIRAGLARSINRKQITPELRQRVRELLTS